MKHLLFILLLFFSFMPSSAQQLILGSVRDGFLKVPLAQARVTLLTVDSVVVQDSIKIALNKKEGDLWGSADFFLELPKKTCTYLLHATLDGYEDAWQTLSVKAEIEDPWGLGSPLELWRISEKSLDEVTVTATKLKMFHKGDTLVYDASAFKLPEGSMLDDLIRQMPGVTMNDDGEIFVNGRKVDELLLGSRTFFGGNNQVLLKNLPYYTVKHIKVYEQESDRNMAAGYEVETNKYVMDVNLKEKYRNGYIANVEAAGGTKERWLGRGFLLGYTDKFRFTLLANANNVNEKRHIGESGGWKPEHMPRSLLTTKSVACEVDYKSKNGLVKDNFMIDFTSSKDLGETVQRRELFMDGSTPYSTLKAWNTARTNRFLARNRAKFTVPQKVYADVSVEFEYKKYQGNSESMSEDFLDGLNTRLQSTSYNKGYWYRLDAGGFISPRIDGILGSLSAFYSFKHNEEKNETARGFITEQFVNPSTATQYNANDFRHRKTLGNLHLLWNRDLGRNFRLELQDRQEYSKKYERDNLYHPDTLTLPSQLDALIAITDPRNSYESDYRTYYNVPTVTLKWRKYMSGPYMKQEYLYLDVNVSNIIRSERLDYVRNNTPQNRKRTSYAFMPSLTFKMFPTKKSGEQLQIRLRYEQDVAPLMDLLDYKDDAMPQIVKLGNPELKGQVSTAMSVNFTDKVSKHKGQVYNLQGDFRYYHRQIAQSVAFNPVNSQYTYQPQNVSGAYEASARFDFTRFLDERQRWSWQTTLNAAYNHSVDHVLQTGMTESAPNAVNTLVLHDGIWLQYQQQDFSIKAIGDIRWRHSEGKMRDFTTLNAFDYQYGLTARYTIPVVKTTLSVDGNMYCRRGYGSNALNRDDFVLNASVSQPFLKGRLIARVEAFDLLHQLSATQYVINAQGRTETWNRTLPNYIMLHAVYHFNRQPKKQ
ncbi:MAG: outer membrane beta-barrel family protein [Paraprevotella sp.]|nr:outer membrane beta-barrel family protein [Paraprevotella sp.]